jgi:hypothetical protein
MIQLEPGLEFLPGVTLVRQLGRGGMGEVWVARHASRGEEVVLKIVSPGAPEGRVALLRREARLVRKLQNPAIVPVYGFEQGPHGSAVVLRYMPGGDASRLRGAKPLEVVRVGRAVAEALEHLHRLGVVHRDVKPTNVLLDDKGRAHLADFGIASVAEPEDDERLVLHGGGSRASMSPQQRAGAEAQPSDDIYALGILLHELLSGRPVFSAGTTDDEMDRGAPPLQAAHPIPEGLRSLVTSMLASDPAGRPRDMRAVGDALRAVEDEIAPPAPALSPPSAPSPSAPEPVGLQPPPRVPEVGGTAPPPVAPPPVSPRPGPRRPAPAAKASTSRPQVLLFAALGLAVLFVVLVLPRLAQRPTDAPEPGEDEPVATEAMEESLDPSPEPVAETRSIELPAEARSVTPPPPEATPAPARRPAPPPATRRAPARSAPPEPSAEQAARRAEEEFQAAMSEAQAALDRRDWPAARNALARASSLRATSPSVGALRRRVEEGERTAALARQRDTARGFEAQEDWRRALAEYEAALKLDPTVTFALEGRDRTKARAELAERLEFHAKNPLRLATDAVAREAEQLLQQAAEVEAPGPRHRQQVAAVERALVEVRTPVAVILESDGETEIVVHKVGRLGTFTQKRLELRPGTYTVIGTRQGFRDVRRQLVIQPAAAPPPLVVRCEEEI